MDYSLDKKLQGFKQIAQEKLQAILCSIPNQKDLIIEPNLIKPLEHVCVASWVKSKSVQRIYKFDQKHPAPKQQNTHVYLISANLLIFKLVLDQIHGHENDINSSTKSQQIDIKNYHIIIMPNVYNSFHILLEEEGLYGVVELHRFNWDFIYMDEGLLSLEIPQVYREIFINHDTSILSSIAHSLRLFHIIFGKPDIILSYGQNSEKILKQLEKLNSQQKTTIKNNFNDFNIMLIIDRDKDYPGCLLTPAIYSGLLLELFQYKSGELEIQKNMNKITNNKINVLKKINVPTKIETLTKIRLNSSYDEIFGENRYKHFSEASNLVRSQAKTLGLEVQNLNKMKLNEMQDYVIKKLPRITEMKNKILKHLNVCEEIIKEIGGNFQKQQSLEEDILNNTNRKQILYKINELLTIDGHKYNIIRLICLYHISIGLNSLELENFIRNYCNMFGHKYLYIFQLLLNANLLPEIEEIHKTKKLLTNLQKQIFQQTEFQLNSNRLKLLITPTTAGTSDQLSNDICPSYVFNGLYIPLIAQLTSFILKSESFDDLYTKIGVIDNIKMNISENYEINSLKQIQQSIKNGQIIDKFPIKKKNIFIFIVGGICYAEIAACNLIGRLTGAKIVIASNCILSGCELIASAF